MRHAGDSDYRPDWVRIEGGASSAQQGGAARAQQGSMQAGFAGAEARATAPLHQNLSAAGQPQADYGQAQPGYGFEPQQARLAQQQAQPTGQPGVAYGAQSAHAAQGAHAAYAGGVGGPGFAPAPVMPQSSQHKKAAAGTKTFLIAFAGAAVACIVVIAVAMGVGLFSTHVTIGSTSSTEITATEDDSTLAEQVAEKALPSVAAITVYAQQSSGSSMLDYFYGFGDSSESSELVEYSQGSGVVLTEDGYILTNQHVIEGGSAFEVTVDGQTYDAELVGYDSSSDIAVLKCSDASGLTPIEIADSDEITVGEWVMSIGSPFGLEQSVATGIVSATSRSQIVSSSTDGSTTVYTNLIQTDAAINPGNSGGALVNSDGQLIGINTLITSYSGNYSGVGFAIPSNYAVSLAEQLISGETPTHASLGVTMTTIDSSDAQRYGFSADSGAYVTGVESGSAADAAGIEVGDIITAVDGEEIEGASDLQLAIRSHDPGDTVTITVNRNGEEIDLEATLGEDANETSMSTQQESYGSGSGSL